MWRLGRQRKIFQLAAIQVVKTEVSEQGPKAGKLLLDDTPIEKTGKQTEGAAWIPNNLAQRITIFDLCVDSVSLSPSSARATPQSGCDP